MSIILNIVFASLTLQAENPDLSSAFDRYRKSKFVSDMQKIVNPHMDRIPREHRGHFKKLLTPYKGVKKPVLTVLNKNEYMLSVGSFGMTARFSQKSVVLNGRLIHIDWSQKPEVFEGEITKAIKGVFAGRRLSLFASAYAVSASAQTVKVFTGLTQAFAVAISTDPYCNRLHKLLIDCQGLKNVESPPFGKKSDLVLKLIGKGKDVDSQFAQCKTYGHKIKKKSLTCAVDSGYKIALELARRFANGVYKKNRMKMRKRILELMDQVIIAHEMNGGKRDTLHFPKIERGKNNQEK